MSGSIIFYNNWLWQIFAETASNQAWLSDVNVMSAQENLMEQQSAGYSHE